MLTSEYETRLATTVERYESKIAALKEENKCSLVNTIADHDTKYAMCVRGSSCKSICRQCVRRTWTQLAESMPYITLKKASTTTRSCLWRRSFCLGEGTSGCEGAAWELACSSWLGLRIC